MDKRVHVVILAGGAGRRLWPWSRAGQRKPELVLVGDRSPLEESIECGLTLVPPARLHLVAADDVITTSGPFQKIREDHGRDTLPALILAVESILKVDPEAVILTLPADHHFRNRDALRTGLQQTILDLLSDPARFWLHGTPATPDSSYGCIVSDDSENVIHFVEKPDEAEIASLLEYQKSSYLVSESPTEPHQILRNCGIFAFGAQFLQQQLIDKGFKSHDAAPAMSIDHALISDPDFQSFLKVRTMDHVWSDLGDWATIRSLHGKSFISGRLSIQCSEQSGIAQYPAGSPVVIESEGLHVDDSVRERVVVLGLDDVVIRKSGETLHIQSGHFDGGLSHLVSHSTIVFNSSGEPLIFELPPGGLVARMKDIVVICSETSLISGELKSASLILDAELPREV